MFGFGDGTDAAVVFTTKLRSPSEATTEQLRSCRSGFSASHTWHECSYCQRLLDAARYDLCRRHLTWRALSFAGFTGRGREILFWIKSRSASRTMKTIPSSAPPPYSTYQTRCTAEPIVMVHLPFGHEPRKYKTRLTRGPFATEMRQT